MFDLQAFVVESHHKVIGHYQQLLASATSEAEAEHYRRRIEEHERSLSGLLREQSHSRAA
jgi:hypothetical protein